MHLPDWSPTGDWITYRDDKGLEPDLTGRQDLEVSRQDRDCLSRLLQGWESCSTESRPAKPKPIQDRVTLFSLDPVTLKQKVIKELGKDLRPQSSY